MTLSTHFPKTFCPCPLTHLLLTGVWNTPIQISGNKVILTSPDYLTQTCSSCSKLKSSLRTSLPSFNKNHSLQPLQPKIYLQMLRLKNHHLPPRSTASSYLYLRPFSCATFWFLWLTKLWTLQISTKNPIWNSIGVAYLWSTFLSLWLYQFWIPKMYTLISI